MILFCHVYAIDQRWYTESPREPLSAPMIIYSQGCAGIIQLSGMVWGGGMLGDGYHEKAIARYHGQCEII